MSNKTRSIPTAKEFTHLKKVDLLYAYLQTISKWDGKTQARHVWKADFTRQEAQVAINVSSVNTITNRLNTLIKSGFVIEHEDHYELTVETAFTLIDTRTLEFLINTANDNVINVYAFLKWKHEFSQNHGNDFYFYNKQIVEDVLGQPYNDRSNRRVNDILSSLKNNGLVNFEIKNIGGFKTQKVLTFVGQYISQ